MYTFEYNINHYILGKQKHVWVKWKGFPTENGALKTLGLFIWPRKFLKTIEFRIPLRYVVTRVQNLDQQREWVFIGVLIPFFINMVYPHSSNTLG